MSLALYQDDWRSWDELSKLKLAASLRAKLIKDGKVQTFCTDPTPSAMAQRYLGEKWHHRAYHDVLDKLAVDMLSGELKMATISQPPQTGKSSWVNWFVFWWQAMHPDHPIIRMSYAAELAVTHGVTVQRYVEFYGGEFGLLPGRGTWGQNNWQTTTGAGLRSAGMLTGVSGFPAALMILDDPLAGRAQADSRIIRDRVWNEYSGSLVSRMRPGAPLLMVLTRWHEDDPAARLIEQHGREDEGGTVREINLPALTADGTPLQHPWIDPEDVEGARTHWETKRASSTLRDWFSLYLGDPRPVEGALLSEDQVKAATWRGELPEPVKTGVAIDPSGGGRDVAGIIGGQVDSEGRVIWTHDRSASMKSEQWARAACELAWEIQANEIVYEHNYGGDQSKLILRTTWEGLQREGAVEGPCPRIVAVNAKKGKRVRAEPIAAQVALGKVFFHGLKVLALGQEWSTWQEDSNESPGRIDASAYLAYRWLKIPGMEAVVSTVNLDETPKTGTGRGTLAGRRVERPAAGR